MRRRGSIIKSVLTPPQAEAQSQPLLKPHVNDIPIYILRVNNNKLQQQLLHTHQSLMHTPKMDTLKTTTRSLPHALALPPKLLSKYSAFVTANQASVTQIETTLRSISYILPSRFRDAELASESLHSSLALLSLYHDSLLTRAISKLPGCQQSPHKRYTKFWAQRSGWYRRVATLLCVVQYTELLWEMAAKRRGERVRWRVVVVLEAIKALCKLFLLRITGARPLVTPVLPERDVLPDEPAREEADEYEEWGEVREQRVEEYKLKRTGLSLPGLPKAGDIGGYLMGRVLTADDIKAPIALLNKVDGTAQIAEILHIIQPVVYAFALSRTKDKRNWTPWLLALSIDYAARQMRNDGLRTTALEKEEAGKRGWAMLRYGMRGAFYENVTKGFLHGTAERLPSFVGGILGDYLFLWDNYYFTTSSD